MSFIRTRLRPMLRVESLVLVVTAWIIATANGAWWRAVGSGRDWSQPANWLFVACCFIALAGLHFALIAPFAFRRVVRPLLTLLVGLGLVEFSMTPGAIPVAKRVLADVRRDEMHALARRVLRMATITEIESELNAVLGRLPV